MNILTRFNQTEHFVKNYKIERIASSTWFTTDYHATDINQQKSYIIREYSPQFIALKDFKTQCISPRSDEHSKAFEDGKQAFLNQAARLKCSNIEGIERVVDYFEDYGTAYQVYEDIEGLSLKVFIEKQAKNPKLTQDLWKLFFKAAGIVSRLEKENFLHGDIRPSTIFIYGNGDVLLRELSMPRRKLAQDISSYGMEIYPAYASPQHYLGVDSIDMKSDMFSLLACFYQAFMGTKPLSVLQRLKLIHTGRKDPCQRFIDELEKHEKLKPFATIFSLKSFSKDQLKFLQARFQYYNKQANPDDHVELKPTINRSLIAKHPLIEKFEQKTEQIKQRLDLPESIGVPKSFALKSFSIKRDELKIGLTKTGFIASGCVGLSALAIVLWFSAGSDIETPNLETSNHDIVESRQITVSEPSGKISPANKVKQVTGVSEKDLALSNKETASVATQKPQIDDTNISQTDEIVLAPLETVVPIEIHETDDTITVHDSGDVDLSAPQNAKEIMEKVERALRLKTTKTDTDSVE